MSTLGVIVVIVVIAVFVLQAVNKGKKAARKIDRALGKTPTASRSSGAAASGPDRTVEANMEWLRDRWAQADRERGAGELKSFPAWYFDAVTERQLERLKNHGVTPPRGLTKGRASDLIGLFTPPAPEDEEVLRFFKAPMRGMSESKTRHEVARLMSDAKNVEAWNGRPADTMQREFFRFFGLKMPKDMTCVQAKGLIEEQSGKLAQTDSAKLDEWESFVSIVTDLNDPETREDHELKKVPLSTLRAVLDALQTEGHSLSDLAGDLSLVAEKLLEMKPELGRI